MLEQSGYSSSGNLRNNSHYLPSHKNEEVDFKELKVKYGNLEKQFKDLAAHFKNVENDASEWKRKYEQLKK